MRYLYIYSTSDSIKYQESLDRLDRPNPSSDSISSLWTALPPMATPTATPTPNPNPWDHCAPPAQPTWTTPLTVTSLGSKRS